MVNRSLAVVRNFAATTTTTAATPTSHPASSGRLEVPTFSGWKRGHNSRGSVGERIQVIPGFKTSAAFLTSLGANLRIEDHDLLPSPANTPSLRPTHDISLTLPPPSPFVGSTWLDEDMVSSTELAAPKPQTPREGKQSLSTELASSETDMQAALALIADSVAQQRVVAARLLVFHPLNIALFTTVLSLAMQWLYMPGEYAKMFAAAMSSIVIVLVSIRQLTLGYTSAARNISMSWLGEDQIIISKLGDCVIGALVLGWEKGEGRGNKRKKWGKGVVRAWTVKMKYRGKGVGSELLEEAVRTIEKRGGEEIVFAEDHANSSSFLPALYNGPQIQRDTRYRKQLEDISQRSLGRSKR